MKTITIKFFGILLLICSLFSLYGCCCCLPDMDLTEILPGQTAKATEPNASTNGHLNAEEAASTMRSGYYVDRTMLAEDPHGVLETLRNLPAGTPVMLEVKDEQGRFFYTSALGERHPNIDAQQVDALIHTLSDAKLYAIACLPAFKEYAYSLAHVNHGLLSANGPYLYLDQTQCYWLDPSTDGALDFLKAEIAELKTLRFDEVVLTDFCFPDTDAIVFDGNRIQTLNTAANDLWKAHGSDTFVITFENTDPDFRLPNVQSRIYNSGLTPEQIAQAAESSQSRLLFTADHPDPRFDGYDVLIPITYAQTAE